MIGKNALKMQIAPLPGFPLLNLPNSKTRAVRLDTKKETGSSETRTRLRHAIY